MESAKEYLLSIKRYDTIIDAKQREIDDLYALITRVTPVLKTDVVSGGGSQDKIGNAIAKITDLQAELNRDIDHFVDLKREVAAKLSKVTRAEYYEILHKRYFEYQSLEQIAVSMNYTYRWIRRLHGRALNVFGKIMNEEEGA